MEKKKKKNLYPKKFFKKIKYKIICKLKKGMTT